MNNYTHLSIKDRQRFCTYLQMKLPMQEISRRLGRHRSSLHRELNRNKESGVYLPKIVFEKASSRAYHGRRSKLQKDGYLHDYVVRSLKKGWSPEQISGRMKYQKLTIYVCPETICQYVYKSNEKHLATNAIGYPIAATGSVSIGLDLTLQKELSAQIIYGYGTFLPNVLSNSISQGLGDIFANLNAVVVQLKYKM